MPVVLPEVGTDPIVEGASENVSLASCQKGNDAQLAL